MRAWQRRRIDLINVLKYACGIWFQIRINAGPVPLSSLVEFADDVTVVPFHPRRAQCVKDRMKALATVAHQYSAVSGSHVQHAQHVV
jgi:predicted RNA binding protein YcfA (HicA-like mRNA interferase family)